MRNLKTILLTVILLSLAYPVFSAEVAPGQARAAVQAWLREDSAPLHAHMGQTVSSIETYRDSQNSPLYYVVNLNPSGFAIVAADDLIEPIVAFAADGRYDPSLDNPLCALVSRDLPDRMKHARKQTGTLTDGPKKARNKWARLQTPVTAAAAATATNSGTGRTNSISDVYVLPLVQSKWNQMTANNYLNGPACYNYFTPNYTNGCPTNYPSGCVATMMAQLMRYYQYPTSGVGTASFQITIDGARKNRSLRGGDGSGGAYSWNDMTLDPKNSGVNDIQRQAIGALTYDAGVSVKMAYAANGSAAYMSDAKAQLKSTFKYSNGIYGYNYNYTTGHYDNIGVGLNGMVNPNLDAGYPVLFGITETNTLGQIVAGHAIVCDGYGYNLGTLYHHLNLGWGGNSDAWYALPVIDTATVYTFTLIDECVYNVYTTGSGEIISGRITDGAGSPLTNATVTAVRSGGSTYTTNTNVRGIYAFPKIPANSTYTLSVSSSGYSFTNQTVTTGLSTDNLASSGNRWGIDFMSFPVVTFDAQGGSVSPVSITVTNGATYGTLPTPARTGYTFGGWWTGVDGTGSQVLSATTVTITSAQTLYAKWTRSFYTLTVNSGTGSGSSYTNGQQVVITASNAPVEMVFDQWIGDTNYVANVYAPTTTVTLGTQDISLTANYTPILYPMTVNRGSGDGSHAAGTVVPIIADPPEPWEGSFLRWIGDTQYVASVTASNTTVTMPANAVTVAATYAISHVTLTASAGANGTISPTSTNVPMTSNVTFTVTASNYYRIATLTTNGTSAGVAFDNASTSYNYTWTNVQAAGTVTVAFVAQVVTNPAVASATVPYSWMAQYGLTNYEADAVLDLDSDGLTAWQEYIAGTDPTNGTSSFKVNTFKTLTSGAVIQWNPVTGRVYGVHWATNLQNSFQTLETNIVWPQASYTDTVHGAQSRSFYRVKVQMAP